MLDVCMIVFRWGARDEANVVRASASTLLSNVTQFPATYSGYLFNVK